MQTGLLPISMTLAIVLTLGSLLTGTSGAAGPPRWRTPAQEQQSNSAKAPAPAQDQSPQQQENKQEAPQAAPSQEGEKPATPEAGKTQTNENPPSAEKPPEEPPSTKADEAQPAPPKGKRKKVPAKPTSGPKKIVVRDGGTTDPQTQLTPGMPHDQATHSQQTTTWLLSSTENNLKRASARPLNNNQQATVQQIKLFIDQANAAMKQGDFQRGHNLAMKAHLLSDDLLKH